MTGRRDWIDHDKRCFEMDCWGDSPFLRSPCTGKHASRGRRRIGLENKRRRRIKSRMNSRNRDSRAMDVMQCREVDVVWWWQSWDGLGWIRKRKGVFVWIFSQIEKEREGKVGGGRIHFSSPRVNKRIPAHETDTQSEVTSTLCVALNVIEIPYPPWQKLKCPVLLI
jgi:hypothetical protein